MVSQFRGQVEALENEKQQLQAEKEQHQQERDEARSQAQALRMQLENTEVRPAVPEESLKKWEFGAVLLLSDLESIVGGGLGKNGGKL